MKDQLTPNPSQAATSPAPEKIETGPPDLDIRSRTWRKRLHAIKEGPFRVVAVACLVMFAMITLMLLVPRLVSDSKPVPEKVWEFLTATAWLAGLFAVMGLVMYPIVLLWRFVSVVWHRRRGAGGEERVPVRQASTSAIEVQPKPRLAKSPSDITDHLGKHYDRTN
jgi:hypothetical protein